MFVYLVDKNNFFNFLFAKLIGVFSQQRAIDYYINRVYYKLSENDTLKKVK
jgi:hypothetical protein